MIYLNDLIGVPFKTHGRDKKGMDCYGLVIEITKRLGVTFPDAFYDNITHESRNNTYNFLLEKMPIEKIDKPEKYCIIFMFIENRCTHVGIYLGNGKFIHTTELSGVCIQSLHRYSRIEKTYYKIRGINDGNN